MHSIFGLCTIALTLGVGLGGSFETGLSCVSNSASESSDPQYVNFTKLDVDVRDVVEFLLVLLSNTTVQAALFAFVWISSLVELLREFASVFSLSVALLFSSTQPRKVTLAVTLFTLTDDNVGAAVL